MIRHWITRWRAKGAEHREMRRKFRQDKREIAYAHVRERAQKDNLLIGGCLAVGGAVVYGAWEAARGASIDPLGLLLAAVVPPLAYLAAFFLIARHRAPVIAYGRYRAEYEAKNPPSPWKAFSQLMPDERGVRIALRLGLSRRYTAAEAEEITCILHAHDIDVKARQPRTDIRLTRDASGASPSIEFVYPDEFEKPQWPLGPGEYPVSWRIRDSETDSRVIGDAVKIKQRQG